MDWPKGASGPSLEGFGERPFIAGRLPNQPDVLTAWVADAPSLSPETAMPPMPLTESEARDVAAWLIDAPSLAPGTAMPPSPITEAEARDIAAWLYTLDER